MLKIKVCGMTKIAQVRALSGLGVDFIGFIFYKKSPRYVLEYLTKEEIKNIKGSFKKTGVFVNESADEILKTVEDCGLDFVQLHGNETPDFCKQIASEVPVIKAFSVDTQTNISSLVQPFEPFASYFLFDSSTKNYGGSGKKFDWKLLKNQVINRPFFLSGGIGADDADSIISLVKQNSIKNLFALDINSKFETEAGVKNVPAIQNFLQQLKTKML